MWSQINVTGKIILICSAMLACCASSAIEDMKKPASSSDDNVHLHDGFQNARIAFERGTATVAFIGGSITEMDGYRPMVSDILRRRFPDTAFTFINAGISSTCSTAGAFRFDADVLSRGPIDLLFIEFAVNDDQDAHHTRATCIRGMEGIIRHAFRANPRTRIVITHFPNEHIIRTLQSDSVPLTIEAHTAVANHYGIPVINLASNVADQLTAGTLTWEQYGGVHPAPRGNAIAARMIDDLFTRVWDTPLPQSSIANRQSLITNSLPAPLDPLSYECGRLIDPAAAAIRGFTLDIPDWPTLKGSIRSRHAKLPLLHAAVPGAEATLAFTGTAIGASILAGPDASTVETSIDGGPFQSTALLHAYSKDLHYPRTVLFADGLPDGPHTLTLRIPPSGGAVRILHFVAN